MMLLACAFSAWSYYEGYQHGGDGGWWQTTNFHNSDLYRQSQQPAETYGKSSMALEQQYPNLVVMFTKNSCPFCQYMYPIMKQAEKEYGDRIKFLFVNVDEQPQYASQYGFSTVPQIVYFKDGQRLDMHGSGNKTMTVEDVENKIANYFKDVLSED